MSNSVNSEIFIDPNVAILQSLNNSTQASSVQKSVLISCSVKTKKVRSKRNYYNEKDPADGQNLADQLNLTDGSQTVYSTSGPLLIDMCWLPLGSGNHGQKRIHQEWFKEIIDAFFILKEEITYLKRQN